MTMVLDTVLHTITDETPETADPIHAHIVARGSDERPVQALILESMVEGIPLTALCGHKWIPSRDPKKYSVCSKCLEIAEFAKDLHGDKREIR